MKEITELRMKARGLITKLEQIGSPDHPLTERSIQIAFHLKDERRLKDICEWLQLDLDKMEESSN